MWMAAELCIILELPDDGTDTIFVHFVAVKNAWKEKSMLP
jgi:hypothetical protein